MAANYEKWMQEMVDAIEKTIQSDCDLDEIIKNSYYSKTHFYRIFGSMIGLSPSEYRNKRRLSCAAVDICFHKRRLLDIAVEYGFASQEVFTRAFEREYGITPGTVRKEAISLPLYEKAEIGECIQKKRHMLQEYDAKLIVRKTCNLAGFESVVTPGSEKIRNLWTQLMEQDKWMEKKEETQICKAGIQKRIPASK